MTEMAFQTRADLALANDQTFSSSSSSRAEPVDADSIRSPKRLARIAGVLYLLVGIFGGFAEGFVDPKMYVAGNAAATAGNVIANSGLVRLGVVSHLLDGTFFVVLATGIICLNAVFQFEGLRVATNVSYGAAFGAAGANSLVLMLLDMQH